MSLKLNGNPDGDGKDKTDPLSERFGRSIQKVSGARVARKHRQQPVVSVSRSWRYFVTPLVIIAALLGADRVIAEHQRKVFKASVSRTVLASLKQEVNQATDQSLRAHWISTNEGGNVEGRISAIDPDGSDTLPIERLSVSLMKQGEKIRKAKTDDDGRFVLEDVPEGVYTLLASGRNGFLAYGVQVLPSLEELDIDELDIDVRKLTPSARRAFYVSYFNLPKNAVVREELQIDAAAVPPQFKTLKRISRNYLLASSALSIQADTADLKGIDEAIVVQDGFQVSLEPDGSFVGHIHPIATDDGRLAEVNEMNLFLIQNDKEIDRVPAEKNGEFRIEDVEPGVYALIAAGKDGFAAMSLQLVAADSAEGDARIGKTKAMYVSTAGPATRRQGNTGFACAYTNDPLSIAVIIEEIERIEPDDDDDEGFLWANGAEQFPVDGFPGGAGGMGGLPSSGFGSPFSSAPGGFSGSGFTNAPFGGTPFVPSGGPIGGSGLPRLFGGRFRLLPVLGLVGGIVALANNNGGGGVQNPGPVSPSVLAVAP